MQALGHGHVVRLFRHAGEHRIAASHAGATCQPRGTACRDGTPGLSQLRHGMVALHPDARAHAGHDLRRAGAVIAHFR
ncbi:hypothetical protein CH75_22820 [Dyella jiangningensis]|nr:hypothetical protein CH75_22820 [Dyella jiangningensis]